jgi:hypothetical protein
MNKQSLNVWSGIVKSLISTGGYLGARKGGAFRDEA